MVRASHLQEERLFECYLTSRSGEPIDPPVAEHLADCGPCAARFDELAAFMDGLQQDGEVEADAIFTPERLHQQQQQIERRIALAGRPARVISFPRRFVRGTITGSNARTAPRWIAAAAAAGLFVGVAVGAAYEWRVESTGSQRFAESSRPRLTPMGIRGTNPADVAADDAFLSDLEAAVERPHTRELRAFDAFTPRVREVRDQH
jgi:anti-sigma factor RsiW